MFGSSKKTQAASAATSSALAALGAKALVPQETGRALVLGSSTSKPIPAKPRVNVWERNGGIYFGYKCAPAPNPDRPLSGDWTALDEEHCYTGEGHIISFGPPGTGKTRRLIMPNLARLLDWSQVNVDPKGTNCAHAAVHRANRDGKGNVIGDNIWVIDPFNVMGTNYPELVAKYPFLKSRGHNPVKLDLTDPEFIDDAKRLAEAIIRIDGGEQAHWGGSAQALSKGLTIALNVVQSEDFAQTTALFVKTKAVLDKNGVKSLPEWVSDGGEIVRKLVRKVPTLGSLRYLIGLPPAKLAGFCKLVIAVAGNEYPELAASLNRFADFSPENRELLSILSTAITQTDWLDSKPIRDDLAREAQDFRRLKSTPITVFLVLPPRYLASHGTWLRIMITSIISPLLRSVEDSKVPCLFVLDEFAQLGHLAVIQDNIALMREYGVKLWTIFQHHGQGQDIYGDRFEDFIATAGVVQSFTARDVTTRKYLSDLSGQRLYWLKTGGTSKTRNTGNEAGVSLGENEGLAHMQGPEFWGHDLGTLGPGNSVLFALDKGVLLRSVMPQPEALPMSAGMMKAARRDIEGG